MGRIAVSAMASAADGRVNGSYTAFVRSSSWNRMRLELDENRVKASITEASERPKVRTRRTAVRESDVEEKRLRNRGPRSEILPA